MPTQEDLIALINASEALTQPEKQYWIELLPTMGEEQIEQLKGILKTEQDKMQQIDETYDKKLEEVSQKYLQRWDSEKVKAAREKRQAEEQVHQEQESAEAEALLKSW